MSEKVFNEWLARLEEGVRWYNVHQTNEWLKQVQVSRKKLRELYKEANEQGKQELLDFLDE